ncbi:MAG TPA: NAD(P)/FAD-dependent oxidoreductase [Bacteroidales bacterium]|nr:NAD(P)/FAD-dependent oxidoreductase [Bacteroidales bacterium]
MNTEKYDVVIVGAGPAGCACALVLAETNIKIAVIDKGNPHKNKICGDALSKDVLNQIEKLPEGIKTSFYNLPHKLRSSGIRFYSPNKACMEIPFTRGESEDISGYVCKRSNFDQILINGIKEFSNINYIQDTPVLDIVSADDGIQVITQNKIVHGKIVVGADGANSLVAKKMGNSKKDEKSNFVGMRAYFENVKGFHQNNFIELHFYKEILPSYLWVFPMNQNMANVGIGVSSNNLKNKKIILKNQLETIIKENPSLSERFKEAKQIGKYEAWGIPVGLKKRKISGNRFLLIGDAASLVDPFTGEGVGNALRSGRIAATHLLSCFRLKQFDEKFNQNFDQLIYAKMGKELKISRTLLNLSKHAWFLNYTVKKANKNEHFKNFLMNTLFQVEMKSNLQKPSFFYNTFIR